MSRQRRRRDCRRAEELEGLRGNGEGAGASR
jgi:hypothetical protein